MATETESWGCTFSNASGDREWETERERNLDMTRDFEFQSQSTVTSRKAVSLKLS